MPDPDARPPTQPSAPGEHLGLHWRRPASRDLATLVHYALDGVAAGAGRPTTSVRELEVTVLGPHSRALVGVDAAGTVRAAGWLTGTGKELLSVGVVAPSWRGQGIGRALLAWQLGAARAALEGRPGTLHAFIDEDDLTRRRAHAAAGFTPLGRLSRMSRTLAPLDASAHPPETGAVFETPVAAELERFVREAFDDGASSSSHAPCTPVELLDPASREQLLDPSLSLVGRGRDGEIALALLSAPRSVDDRHGAPGTGGPEAADSIDSIDSIAGVVMGSAVPGGQDLMRAAWGVLTRRGKVHHDLHVPVESPWRAVLHDLDYADGPMTTHWVAAL